VKRCLEGSPGEFHSSEGMLKTGVLRTGPDEPGSRQLVDLTEALDWPRIDYALFEGGDRDELMDRVPDFHSQLIIWLMRSSRSSLGQK
jgi:hypothetical protein